MATTISQRIALEGGEEIRRQLEAIGKAGKASFDEIEKAGLQAAQSLNRFVQSVASVERSFAAVGSSARGLGVAFGGAFNNLSQFDSALTRTIRNTTLFAGAIAGVVFGSNKLIQSVGKAADELSEQAQSLGISVAEYEKLSGAARTAGINQNQFGRALTRFNNILAKDATEALQSAGQKLQEFGIKFAPGTAGAKAQAEAIGRLVSQAEQLKKLQVGANIRFAPGAEEAADQLRQRLGQVQSEGDKTASVLKQLGISAIDPTTGKVKNLGAAFLEFADKFSKLEEGPKKVQALTQAVGIFGRRFADLLNRGGPGIEELAKRFSQLSLADQVKDSERYQDALEVLGATATQASERLKGLFAPELTRLANEFTQQILNNFSSLEGQLKSIIDTRIRPVIDNLVTLLRGAGGAQDESQLEVVDSWTASISAFGDAVKKTAEVVRAAFAGILAAANAVAGVLNTVFGTQLSGGALIATAAILKFLGVFGLLTSALRLAGSLFLVLTRGVGLLVAAFQALGAVLGVLRFLPVLLAGLVGLPALIAAGLIAAGAAIVVFWDEIKTGAAAAWEAIRAAFSAGLEFIGKGWDAITSAASATWEAIKAGASAAWEGIKSVVETSWQGIVSFLTTAAQGLSSVWASITSAATTAWNTIASGAAGLAQRISGALSSAISFITAPFQSIVSRIGQIFSSVTSAAADLANQIKALISAGLDISAGVDVAAKLIAPFQAAAQQIQGIWQGIGQFVADIFLQLSDAVDQTVQKIEQAADRALRALERVLDVAREAAQTAGSIDVGGGGDGFARGGLVRGPGSRTSDSIPAWLSNREYVVNAKAVEHYGVGLLSAINSMRFRVPKFSLGGLAESMSRSLASLAVPRFADGGLVDFGGHAAGLRPLTVVIENGGSRQAFAGLLAPADVADNMVRFAVSSQRAALGRKPSCY